MSVAAQPNTVRHPSESWDLPQSRALSLRHETPAFAGVTGKAGAAV